MICMVMGACCAWSCALLHRHSVRRCDASLESLALSGHLLTGFNAKTTACLNQAREKTSTLHMTICHRFDIHLSLSLEDAVDVRLCLEVDSSSVDAITTRVLLRSARRPGIVEGGMLEACMIRRSPFARSSSGRQSAQP